MIKRAALTTGLPPQPSSGHTYIASSAAWLLPAELAPVPWCSGQQLNSGLQVLFWQLEVWLHTMVAKFFLAFALNTFMFAYANQNTVGVIADVHLKV